MNDGSERIEVEILGEVYRLRTDDRDSLNKSVKKVDETMKEIQKNTRSFAGSRVAVLAALKIAEELFQLKKDYDELLELLDENK
ncbi:MAG: cell division protein ZapA [Selenomonadaceae bacterium]|nr:cell division protein ZapA [Selenomonadaceae bacterium]